MKNIEQFNLCAAHLLVKLHNHFPVGIKLRPAEIVRELNGAIADGVVNKVDANTFVAYTVRWLVQTGYFLEREGTTTANNKYVLSPKAFEALNAALPAALGGKTKEEQKTVGEKLAEAAMTTGKEAGKEAKTQTIRQIIGWILGLAFS
ncbi:MAG: hypothetical protein R3D51_00985 [Hyphomicrobiaceae bacterium]